MQENRVALLIDGENLSAKHAGFAVKIAEARGRVVIRRIYGHLGKTGGWATMPGFRIMHTPSGKNIGDLALSLDALEMALTGQADEFFLATSDRDLALVALRLRELGFRVTGIGEANKVATEFRAACQEFVEVKSANGAVEPVVNGKPSTAAKMPFEARLRLFIEREGDKAGWVSLNALGQQKAKAKQISKEHADIGKSASWISWFKKHQDTFELDERGTQSRVRLKST